MYNVDFFKDELALIRNLSLRMLVQQALERAPAYFWTAPASSTGKYHPPDSNGVGGLCRHTAKVVWFAHKFCDAYNIQPDIVVAAALLHDYTKFGTEAKMETGRDRPFYKDHARIAAGYLAEKYIEWTNNDISDESIDSWKIMCECIHSHMGRWGNSTPETKEQEILHLADLAASLPQFIALKFQDDAPTTLPAVQSGDKIIMTDGIPTINFGKYGRGDKQTVAWVVENDPGYVRWVMAADDPPFEDIVIDAFNVALDDMGTTAPLMG